MINDLLSKIRKFIDNHEDRELFEDVIAELTNPNTITISVDLENNIYQVLATLTFSNGHFLLNMSPAAVANSYFTNIIQGIVEEAPV